MALNQTSLPAGTRTWSCLVHSVLSVPLTPSRQTRAHLVCALCRFRFDAASRPAHLHAHTLVSLFVWVQCLYVAVCMRVLDGCVGAKERAAALNATGAGGT